MFARIKKELADLKAQWQRVAARSKVTEERAHEVRQAAGDTTSTRAPSSRRAPGFHRDSRAPEEGTHQVTNYKASFNELVKRLGKPDFGDQGETESIQWAFVSGSGEPVFLYADPTAHSPSKSPIAFWDDARGKLNIDRFKKVSIRWSVIARTRDVGTRFSAWLTRQAKKPARRSTRRRTAS